MDPPEQEITIILFSHFVPLQKSLKELKMASTLNQTSGTSMTQD